MKFGRPSNRGNVNAGGGGGGGFGRGGRGGRGGGGRGGGGFNRNRNFDQGPPDQVIPLGYFDYSCENDIVCKVEIDDVPYFNAPVYFENKEQVGKVDEIFGTVKDYSVSIKLLENISGKGLKQNQKIFIDPSKLLPISRFMPKVQAKNSKRSSALNARGGGKANQFGGSRGFRRGGNHSIRGTGNKRQSGGEFSRGRGGANFKRGGGGGSSRGRW